MHDFRKSFVRHYLNVPVARQVLLKDNFLALLDPHRKDVEMFSVYMEYEGLVYRIPFSFGLLRIINTYSFNNISMIQPQMVDLLHRVIRKGKLLSDLTWYSRAQLSEHLEKHRLSLSEVNDDFIVNEFSITKQSSEDIGEVIKSLVRQVLEVKPK